MNSREFNKAFAADSLTRVLGKQGHVKRDGTEGVWSTDFGSSFLIPWIMAVNIWLECTAKRLGFYREKRNSERERVKERGRERERLPTHITLTTSSHIYPMASKEAILRLSGL